MFTQSTSNLFNLQRAGASKPVILCADADGTLLRSCEPTSSRISIIGDEMTRECLKFLDNGYLLVATSADRPFIDMRVVSPLIRKAEEYGMLSGLERFAFISNGGARAGIYDPGGKKLGGFADTYNRSNAIDKDLWGPLQDCLCRVLGTAENPSFPVRIESRPVPAETSEGFGYSRSILPNSYPQDFILSQVTIASFPPDGSNLTVMKTILDLMETDYPELVNRLTFSNGGGINIDICKKGVNKASGIRTLLDHWKINDGTVYGIGDGFTVGSSNAAEQTFGGDMSMLDVPGLTALVVNGRRESLQDLFTYANERCLTDRICPLGPGHSAALAFLRSFNILLEDGAFSFRVSPKEPVEIKASHRLVNHGPVVLVSSRHEDVSNIMTLAWITPLSASPKLMGISVGDKRLSHDLIMASGEFAINVPEHSLIEALMACGTKSGLEVNKFDEAGLTPVYAQTINAPLIGECAAHLECRLVNSVPAGDHTLFIGEVVAASAVKGFIGHDGIPDLETFPTLGHLGGPHFAKHDRIMEK